MTTSNLIVTAVLCVGLTLGLALIPSGAAAQGADVRPTDMAQLEVWLQEAVVDAAAALGRPAVAVQGGGGAWQAQAFGRPMVVLADPLAGRMRLMVPVLDEHGAPPEMNEALLTRVMQANFATALDARYALRDGQLWTAFIHPLPTLSREGLRNGMLQAATLAHTFGTTYTSTGLELGGGEPEPQPDAEDAGGGHEGLV